jgi:hypothetical protein
VVLDYARELVTLMPLVGRLVKKRAITLPVEEDKYFQASLFYPPLTEAESLIKNGFDVDICYLGDSKGNPVFDTYKSLSVLDRALFEKGVWKLIASKLQSELVKCAKMNREIDKETIIYIADLMKKLEKEPRPKAKGKEKGLLERLGLPSWARRGYGEEEELPEGSGLIGKILKEEK